MNLYSIYKLVRGLINKYIILSLIYHKRIIELLEPKKSNKFYQGVLSTNKGL